MELETYRMELLHRVGVNAEANSNFDRSEFVKKVMDLLIDSEIISDYVPCHYEGNAGAKGKKVEIDAYGFDEDDNTFSVAICSFTGSLEMQKISKGEVEKAVDRAVAFIESAIDGSLEKNIDESEDAFELARYIRELDPCVDRYKIHVISDSARSDKMDTLPVRKIGEKEAVPCLWDILNLHGIETSKEGRETITIEINDFGVDGIPCIRAFVAEKGPKYESYLCVIPGSTLSALYDRFGSRLLESNVRSFLDKTKVNKNIMATIKNEPDMFFSFNNGITATVTDIIVEDKGGMKFVTGLTALQIVNGGQTTVSLYTAWKKDKPDMSSIFVPMKISVIPTDDAAEIVPRISRSANTQNKVTEADFFSNHPFHVRMEELSRRIIPPMAQGSAYAKKWYYERVRGQYRQDKAKGGKAFEVEYPKDQVFTKMELAYYRMCYIERPFYLIQGHALRELSKEVLEKWGNNGPDYNELYFKESIALGMIYRAINENVSKQEWYQTGAKIETVSYTFSKFFNIVKEMDKTFDLQKIWKDQKVPKILVDQLMDIAKVVNRSINEDKEESNVRSWCKKTKCWDKVRSIHIPLRPELNDLFIRKGLSTWQQKAARTDQKMSTEVHARIEVVNLGPAYWEKMYEWGIEFQMLDGTERSILRTAFEKGTRSLPSDRQSVEIIKIRNKLIERGYKP